MKIIGLTGNIGSGKSIVSRIFSVLGIPVYHADEESKKLFQHNEIRQSLREIFGDVFDISGQVDRKKLATIVFSDPALLSKLNNLLHPLVREDFRAWVNARRDSVYVIQEAAIIFESGFANEFDKIIHVACPAEIAIERVMNRDHVSREEVVRRRASQMDEKEKAALADFIILNDGLHMVIPQVLSLHDQLLKGSA
ncbi:MAG TPA: dephospho-CoA kinase [Bacteroidales bacterium]|nr:dephospho-CoA kinase [Bacteroidales bacterium]